MSKAAMESSPSHLNTTQHTPGSSLCIFSGYSLNFSSNMSWRKPHARQEVASRALESRRKNFRVMSFTVPLFCTFFVWSWYKHFTVDKDARAAWWAYPEMGTEADGPKGEFKLPITNPYEKMS
jgi:hypothetical protein